MAAQDRPTIIVHLGAGLTEDNMAEVFYGMEEEGVPFQVRSVQSTDPGQMAHDAAIESRLGIGVGAGGSTIVVTTEKLPASSPYITKELNVRRDLDRSVGANAARLVKRIPLREMSNS
jgi:hypothetical protein